MFDLVRNNKKIVQIILAIIILPFALWGVDAYIRDGGGANEIASVGGTPITLDEFQRALSEQQDRLRPQLGANAAAFFDQPAFRQGVLEDLINQRLLQLYANQARIGVTNEQLAAFIASLPALQVDGKFSRERYEQLVAAQNMSIDQFEAMLRRDLVVQQLLLPIANAAMPGKLPLERWLAAQLEARQIAEHVWRSSAFESGVEVDAAAIERYYTEHRERFAEPERVRVEFLVLSQKALIEAAQVSDSEIKAFYEANAARFRQPEQRRARHILIRVDKDAPSEAVKAAEDKARELLARLKSQPADFAKLAQQHSQDPGSAAKGGDLGFFGRGMMVKPFEEAAFALKENQISDLVRSDFGFHIIQLNEIRPAQVRPLEAVRDEIVAELKRAAGAKHYAESAEGFSNLVYEQADSLKPAAEKYGLALQKSDWLAKDGALPPPFDNAKLRQAIFSSDAVEQRRNTEAIEVAPNTLVAARVIEHQPARVLPLEEVRSTIISALKREAAQAKAVAAGEAELDKLKRGEASALKWSAARTVTRMSAEGLPPESVQAIFAAPTERLPAYVGTRVAEGYALYRIDQVKPYDPAANADNTLLAQLLAQQYNETVAREELASWLAALRTQFGVKINRALLEKR